MTSHVERAEDRLADFTRDKRILILSLMALLIGALSAVVAKILVWLIAIITNLVFYRTLSSEFVSPVNHRLGPCGCVPDLLVAPPYKVSDVVSSAGGKVAGNRTDAVAHLNQAIARCRHAPHTPWALGAWGVLLLGCI